MRKVRCEGKEETGKIQQTKAERDHRPMLEVREGASCVYQVNGNGGGALPDPICGKASP